LGRARQCRKHPDEQHNDQHRPPSHRIISFEWILLRNVMMLLSVAAALTVGDIDALKVSHPGFAGSLSVGESDQSE
jgi:hypothetical protein